MRVLNDNNQWVGDGQVVDRNCECIHSRRLGPPPWYPYRSQEEEDAARDEFVASLVAEIKSRQEMKMVRAKFMVQEIRQHYYGNPGATTVILRPQYDQSIEEDKRFAKATPTGEVSMYIDNPPAQAFFELGKTYYLDFSKAN